MNIDSVEGNNLLYRGVLITITPVFKYKVDYYGVDVALVLLKIFSCLILRQYIYYNNQIIKILQIK